MRIEARQIAIEATIETELERAMSCDFALFALSAVTVVVETATVELLSPFVDTESGAPEP